MVTLVKTLMTLKGVSQTDISNQTGVSVAAISRFMNGASELRSEALFKILSVLGTDVNYLIKKEINQVIGNSVDVSIGEDIKALIEKSSPINKKTITDTIIASFKNEKDPDTLNRILRIKKYRDSIKTVRRATC